MSISRPFSLCACLAILLTAPSALAGDYYVSESTGNNANDGLTPGTAWRNISFALANVPLTDPSGKHTVHVAPGTYSVATGETFPLEVEAMLGTGAADIEIVSDGGQAVTQIVGSGSTTFSIRSRRLPNDGPFFKSRITRIEGFHITPQVSGISVVAVGGNLNPTLKDLEIEGGTGFGMSFGSVGDSFIGTSGDITNPMVMDCEVHDMDGNGASVTAFGDLLIFTSAEVTFTNVVLRDNGGNGLGADAEDSETQVNMIGCTIIDNDDYGASLNVFEFNFGGVELDAEKTLIAKNGLGGVVLDGFGFGFGGPFLVLQQSTIADNAGIGVEALLDSSELDAETSILHGNMTDISGTFSSKTVEYSDVGSGDAGSSMTNISEAPLYVDRINGDFRLRDGSPCIDTGNPALPLDSDGTVADMGAFPFDQAATSDYCAGKSNSLGCVPYVNWTGFASVTAPTPFRVRALDVLPNEGGLIVYGFQAGNLNFHGGKLCVKAPLQRLLPVKIANSSGTPPCSGVLQREFNSRIQSGADALLTAGQTVYAQWRTRDPADPAGFGDGATNGVQFTIAP